MHLSAPAPEHLPPALAAKLQTLLAPPTAPRPVATDERYSPLRAEITKIDALTVLEDPPNWPRIAALSAAILADSGKDLLIAAYAALAFFKTNDLPGLTLGLHFFSELFLNNAPDLTPTRPKNRSIALSWYLDHLLRDPPRPPIRPEQAPLLRALPAQIRRLRALADDHLGEFTPSFSPLLKIIEALTAELPPEPDTAPTDTAPTDTTPAPTPEIATPPAPEPLPERPPQEEAATAPPTPLDELRLTVAPWLAPITPEAPCGADPIALEQFSEITAEVNKLSALTDNEVNWRLVETASEQLLKRSSKDLRLVAYLILARQSRLGPADLAFGLTLLADTLDTYPEALHPRRPKPRQIFLNWLIEKLAAALQLAAAAPRPLAKPANNLSPAANFLLQKAAATRLSAVLQERFGDAAPSTRPLRDAIEALAPPPEPTPEADPFTNTSPTNPSPTSQNNPQTISQTSSQTSSQTLSQTTQPDAATTPPTPSQPRTAESTTPPTPTATTEPSPPTPAPIHVQSAQSVAPSADLSQLDRFLDATDDALAQTARALREAIPTDPRAYRLLRIGLWLKLTAPPAAKPDGTTGVLPLPDRDREALFQLHAKQQWPALLQRSENFLTRHRYLLDLQRLSHAALTGLGPDYAPAALALRAELTALLLRFPTLPFLRDRDGAPLADPDTQTWLTHQIPTSTSTTTPTNPPLPLTTPTNPTTLPLPLSTSTDPASDPFWHDLPARLRSAPHQTLTEAQAHLDQSPTGHHRFTRALTLAEALLNAGDPQRAAYLFAGLAADADRHHLDRWDLLLLIRCLQGAAHAHHLTNNLQARDQTLQRLAPLAPTLETLSLCWLDL